MAFYNIGLRFYPGNNMFAGCDTGYNPIPDRYYDPPPMRFPDRYYDPPPMRFPDRYYDPPPMRFPNPDPPPSYDYGLPPVDPFNYPGPIRFGPSITIIGPHPPDIPPGAGVFDPYLVVPGSATLRIPY